ncbi:MAG: hypothetical protein PHH91_11940 [Desulfuromonadaceae bacterium]|nr:hypothetical protein [Desulfuromonadaceae bacterium]
MKQTRMMVLGSALALLLAPGMAFSGNLADVTQVGDSNVATADQAGAENTANVSQYGNKSKADVDQIGNSNTATVAQGTSGSPINSGDLVGYVTGAKIYQEGNSNTASTTWHVGNLGSRISQIGDSNLGSQDLAATSGYKAGKYAIDIQQAGDDNEATQITMAKYGTYGIQDMLIQQTGNGNAGTQTSISGVSYGMDIVQTGDSNISSQYQDGMHDVASANMVGNGNVTNQTQSYTLWGLTSRTATIDILGDTNNVTQSQFGVSSTADIDINGNANIATQNQTGNNNFAKLTQNGNGNIASQLQTGNLNSSTVLQTGNLNTAMVVQNTP